MRNTRGGLYWAIGLLLIFVIIDVALATWLITPPGHLTHVVQPGDTVDAVAARYHLHPQVLMEANSLRPGEGLVDRQALSIPTAPLAPFSEWELQLIGLGSTLLGVWISFSMANMTGLLPGYLRGRILTVSLAVALVSYATIQASRGEPQTAISPMFILGCIKDGFAWSVSVPLLGKLLGLGPMTAST